MTTYSIKDVETPHGRPAQFRCRDGTSDLATVGASNRLWGNLVDEYLIPEGLTGYGLDVGAHIGSVTVPLLLDNPELRVVAIEAVPDNVEMLTDNLTRNGVLERATILAGAAWKASGVQQTIEVEYGYTGSELAETHAYIGSVTPWLDAPGEKQVATVQLVSLKDVIALTGGKGFVWVKSDCEGCEHIFFRGAGLSKLGTIVGEWHQRDGTPEDFAKRLSKTHEMTWSQGIGGGPFRAVRR
jgi:FkbM family methyltransferase